jgi:hypothetical protein
MFHMLSAQAGVFSLTPSFSWVWKRVETKNRFNGLPHAVETVETVTTLSVPIFTQLKLGVNESACIRRSRVCEISRSVINIFSIADSANHNNRARQHQAENGDQRGQEGKILNAPFPE